MKKKRPVVLVVVEGGIVTEIRANFRKLDVFILDHDNAADPQYDPATDLSPTPHQYDPRMKYLAAFEKQYAKLRCSICHNLCLARSAHLHQRQWIGDECCWTETLRSSE